MYARSEKSKPSFLYVYCLSTLQYNKFDARSYLFLIWFCFCKNKKQNKFKQKKWEVDYCRFSRKEKSRNFINFNNNKILVLSLRFARVSHNALFRTP